MAHTYEDLKAKTVAQLREIAAGIDHEALKGYTQLNKDHLLVALCKALSIEMHAHHEVKGINKTEIKTQIQEFKKKRDAALVAGDHDQHKTALRRIHHLKRELHKATV